MRRWDTGGWGRQVWLLLLVAAGAGVAGACSYFALQDFAELGPAYRSFHAAAAGSADLRALFAAYAAQDIHRTNLFADGTWALLGLVIAAIGLHGLCAGPAGKRGR